MSEATSVQEGSEPSQSPATETEVSQRANERIQQLVREKKEAEAKVQAALAREQQYQKFIAERINQPTKTEPSSTSLSAEEELIVKELGGDETAQKLHRLLSKKFEHDAKARGLVPGDEILQRTQQMIEAKFGQLQNTVFVTNRIAELAQSGRLDGEEAKWVTEQATEEIGRNPAWLNNQSHTRMLINDIVQRGYDGGKIKLAVKQSGKPTLVTPGSGAGGQQADEAELSDLRTAAQRFSTLSNLKDDQLQKLAGRIRVADNQTSLTDAVKAR